MAWVEKQHQTAFEQVDLPLQGLFFLDGDLLAEVFGRAWTQGMKSPMLMFPSNNAFALWETARPETGATVNLLREVDLSLYSSRDAAFSHIRDRAVQLGALVIKKGDRQLEVIGLDDAGRLEQVGYFVLKKGDQQLEIRGLGDDEHFLLTYDPLNRRLEDVQRLREKPAPPPALLDEDSRERLPQLDSGAQLGREALAQVKFFTPDADWIWYASEFDSDELFFGLVIGDFIEFGSFSLSELAEVRGAFGLPVERDEFFTPTTLGELPDQHEADRRRE